MSILSIIKSIFGKKKENKQEEIVDDNQSSPSPDFIDYDGMGNQGRFVKKKINKKQFLTNK